MIVPRKEKDLCQAALKFYGEDAQILKTIEELNEFAVVLMHYRDKKTTGIDVENELAVVIIMCDQMCILFGSHMKTALEMKLARLDKRIEHDKVTNNINKHKWGDVL